MSELQRLFELLTKEFEAQLTALTISTADTEAFNKEKIHLYEKINLYDKKVKELDNQKQELLMQKAYIGKLLAQKEQEEKQIDIKLNLLKDEQKKALAEAEVTKKLKVEAQKVIDEAKNADTTLKQIVYERQLLAKEKIIDRERKEVIIIQEQKLDIERQRLERLSQNLV